MTRKQIREAVARFRADKNRVVSEKLLSEIAGISFATFRKVFCEDHEMSEMVQIRMERALQSLARGELRVMQNKNRTRYIEYRKEPKPEFRPGTRLQFKGNRISLVTGLRNLNDYSQPTLKDDLEK